MAPFSLAMSPIGILAAYSTAYSNQMLTALRNDCKWKAEYEWARSTQGLVGVETGNGTRLDIPVFTLCVESGGASVIVRRLVGS